MTEEDKGFCCDNWCPARCVYQYDEEKSAIEISTIATRINYDTNDANATTMRYLIANSQSNTPNGVCFRVRQIDISNAV